LKNFFKFHFWFIAWLLTIFIQSSFPAVGLPQVEIISLDKVIHMGVFGLLTLLCYISIVHLQKENLFSDKPLIWSAVFCIIYGASDEIHQYFVPNRSAELQDWAADVAGIILACLLINYFLKKGFVLFKGSLAK
jgi:VanZ family protein